MYRAAWHLVSFQSCVLPTPIVEESTEAWGARQDRECGVQFAYMQAHQVMHDTLDARYIHSTQGLRGGRKNCVFGEELHHVRFYRRTTKIGKWIGWCWSTHPGITSRTERLRKTRWIPFSTEPLSYIKLKTRYRWRRLGNQDFNVGQIGSERFPCIKLGNHACNRLQFCL